MERILEIFCGFLLLVTISEGAGSNKEVKPKQEPEFDGETLFGLLFHGTKNLSKNQKLKRVKEMFVEMDEDKDESLTSQEIQTWLDRTHRLLAKESMHDMFPMIDRGKDNFIDWAEYCYYVYNTKPEEVEQLVVHVQGTRSKKGFTSMHNNLRTKFSLADRDKDGKLSREEYDVFNHHGPDVDKEIELEDIKHLMHLDNDKDGNISFEEYFDPDIAPTDDREYAKYRRRELNAFKKMDKNGDGQLSQDEYLTERLPHRMDMSDMPKFIHAVDQDKSGTVTLEEAEGRYLLFTGRSNVRDERAEL